MMKRSAVFESAFDTFQNGLILFDAKGRLVAANMVAREYLAKFDIVVPQSMNAFLDFMYDRAAESQEGSFVHTLDLQSNKELKFRETLDNGAGGIYRVEAFKSTDKNTIFTLSDISDFYRHEQEVLRLQQFSNKLYYAVEAATNGIVVMRIENQIPVVVFANSAFCEIFEIEKDEARGQTMHDIFALLNDGQAQEQIKNIIVAKDNRDIEISLDDDAGMKHWYGLKLTYLKTPRRGDELFIGVMNDLTKLKQREAEFFHAQKLEALGQMAAGLAHDFNNVLSIIDGYSRLAISATPDHPAAHNHLERIQMASVRGASLIKKMLTFSRHQIVVETVIDLGETLKEQELLLRPLLDASVQLRIITPTEKMYVECPPDSFTQILMNLCVNARDAMEEGGALILDVKTCAGMALPEKLRLLEERVHGKNLRNFACLSVQDTGTGMRQDTINRIFDPFFTTKDQGKGTGLGLSMVYGLVRQVKGYIDVKSTYGYGTEMQVYFPLTDKKPNRIISGSPDAPETITFDGFTALVAEDEPDLLMLVSDMLEKMGMNVLKAANGLEALALQDDYEGKIDVLLTDVVMPEMDGVELAELLIALRPDIKTFFMSGYPAESRSHQRALPKGAYFMAKPIKYEALSYMIYQSLHEKKDEDPMHKDKKTSQHWVSH